jgi:parallel beta-helix repeat protein
LVLNNIISNNDFGIDLTSSTNISLRDNIFIRNGIFIYGNFQMSFWNTHDIDTSNTVNGRPVYYWKNQNNKTIPSDAGEVILANCSNIRIENQNLTNSSIGMELGFSSNNYIANSSLLNNAFAGIYLWFSDNNTIVDNEVSANQIYGICSEYTFGNEIKRNNASNNIEGINIYKSINNYVINNNIISNSRGISLSHSDYSHINGNNILSNNKGLISQYSDVNNIDRNLLIDNNYGLTLIGSSENNIFHNSFINNTNQASDDGGDNIWDNGYPLGGNYWSDYSGVDNLKGPNQNRPGKDGIGDTNHSIDSDSVDNYPLMETFLYITPENYTILEQGWNLISIPLIQNNKDLIKVLEMIDGYYDAVQWYNAVDTSDHWKHNKIGKPFGNDLYELNESMGFWIHITQPGETIFIYNGTKPSVNQTIDLIPSWNLVGYSSLSKKNRTDALNNIDFGNDVDAIWTFNATTKKWKEITESDNFELGRGYWIHSKVTKTWIVPL